MSAEKKVLVGSIQKFSTEDGPGIRTTVFLKGCPLNCQWCHNPELIDPQQQLIRLPNSCIHCAWCLDHCPEHAIYVDEDKKINIDRTRCRKCMSCVSGCYAKALQAVATEMTSDEIMFEVLQDKGFYANSGGGMTISGGEMLTHPEMVTELLDIAAKENVSVCLDTSGYGDSDTLLRLAKHPAVSHILFDMKAIDDTVHQEYTGVSNQLILKNLTLLSDDPETNKKIIMRMPLIRGVNDTKEIIQETGKFYQEHHLKKVTLLPYHDLGLTKSRNIGRPSTRFDPPTEEHLQEMIHFFQNIGMSVEVLGRV